MSVKEKYDKESVINKMKKKNNGKSVVTLLRSFSNDDGDAKDEAL